MSSSIRNISVDCANPFELAQFWSQVLDLPMETDDKPGDAETGLSLDTGEELLFLKVPEPKTVKNRMHLCLVPQQIRDTEVERLLTIGATLVDDRRESDGTGWAVLADPEGNEFCVLRSDEERAKGS